MEFNTNMAFAIGTALIFGASRYGPARKSGQSRIRAARQAIGYTLFLLTLSVLWAVTLNRLGWVWNSLRGYALGLAFGIVGLIAIVVFHAIQRRLGRSL